MKDERIYHEYANWKVEHYELFKYFAESDSGLFIRFKHVLEITDYFYDKLIDDMSFSEDDDYIFESGFNYMYDQVDVIDHLLEKSYQRNFAELEKHSKDVTLLLTSIDFLNELVSIENSKVEDLEKMKNFEEEILKIIENKQEVPKEKFTELDHLSREIFSKMDEDYYPTYSIFLDIADELGLL